MRKNKPYNKTEAAKRAGLTVGRLIEYERHGLQPETFANGCRMYDDQDVEKAKQIHAELRNSR